MKFNSGIIRYNLIQDCLYSYVHYSMGGGYFQFSNNVFYRSKDGNGTSSFDPWGGGTASYVNNVFYDGKGTRLRLQRRNQLLLQKQCLLRRPPAGRTPAPSC